MSLIEFNKCQRRSRRPSASEKANAVLLGRRKILGISERKSLEYTDTKWCKIHVPALLRLHQSHKTTTDEAAEAPKRIDFAPLKGNSNVVSVLSVMLYFFLSTDIPTLSVNVFPAGLSVTRWARWLLLFAVPGGPQAGRDWRRRSPVRWVRCEIVTGARRRVHWSASNSCRISPGMWAQVAQRSESSRQRRRFSNGREKEERTNKNEPTNR